MSEVGTGPFSSLQALANVAAGKTGSRVAKLGGAALTGHAIYQIGTGWKKTAASRRSLTVAVVGSDAIYDDIHAWLLENIPSDQRRALIARSASGAVGRHIKLFYDGSASQRVTVDGHTIQVGLKRPEWLNNVNSLSPEEVARFEQVTFTCPNEAARDAVLTWLGTVAEAQYHRQPRFYVSTIYGDWDRRQDIPPRPLDSVVLRRGDKERLTADLDTFLASEAEYAKWGQPWRRGYLLHGPPGTGKTSIAAALANHAHLDVHFASLSAMQNDSRLLSAVKNIDTRGVLLLEDIDVVHAARDRDDESGGVTLSGLLNALDGIATPHGLITIMTTNNPAVLDSALLRRANFQLEVGYADRTQVADLVEHFGCQPPSPNLTVPPGLTSAAVVEALRACGSVDHLLKEAA